MPRFYRRAGRRGRSLLPPRVQSAHFAATPVLRKLIAENRGRVTCLIDPQVAWMAVCVGTAVCMEAQCPRVKGTQRVPIGRPSTARVVSARSARPLSAGDYGLVCPGE